MCLLLLKNVLVSLRHMVRTDAIKYTRLWFEECSCAESKFMGKFMDK